MRYFIGISLLLLIAGSAAAQDAEAWRRGYESRLAEPPITPRSRDGANIYGTYRVPLSLGASPYDRTLAPEERYRSIEDFNRVLDDTKWPRIPTTTVRVPQYRSVDDDVEVELIHPQQQQRPRQDYRNPYRNYRLSDSNRFNNDSDKLTPEELHYKPRYRPIYIGSQRYTEYEQALDDATSQNPTGDAMTGMRSVLKPRLDMSRWR